MDVSEGDEVLYSKYGGTEITIDGEDLLVLRESDVLAKVAGKLGPNSSPQRNQTEELNTWLTRS